MNDLGPSVRARAGPHLPPGPAVVALSGGADSAIAAWVASVEGVAPLRAVFVDHGLPGSGAMAAAAAAVAAHLGLVLTAVAVVVPGGPSPEDQARKVRLAALEAAAAADETIITGHTRDDQAETVLGNLLRGAGPRGLAGIRPSRGPWRRPLLEVTRAETRSLAESLSIPFRDDPANADRSVRRNRIRNDLIPDLEAVYNPALREALGRSAALFAADDDHLEVVASHIPIPVGPDLALLPVAPLSSTGVAVASRTVRRALRTVRGPHAGTAREVGEVLAVVAGRVRRASLGGGFLAEREGPYVAVYRPEAAAAPSPVSLRVGDVCRFGRFTIAAREDPATRPAPLSPAAALVAPDAVTAGIVVRAAVAGDRIALAGGTKPVRDAMAEAGIPLRLRSHWPVAEAHGKIVWVPAVRTAHPPAPAGPRVRLTGERDGWWT